MTPPPPSRIRLCGALEVEIEGTRIEPRLRGTQGRLLLAYLVLNRERPVLRRELEGALWEGRRPAASDALSPSLSRLRQAVGAERLPGRDHLQLRLGNAPVVDVEVARGQVEDGRMALAADDVRAARASALRADATLGQGLLPGLEAGWLAHHREQSRELRLDALEIAAVAGTRLGRDALPAAEQAARAAVELAPLRESARVVLLDVLAARGNVAEALVEFERARTLLRDQLGSVPGPELRAAHGDLLRRSSRAADSSAARLGAAGASGGRVSTPVAPPADAHDRT